MDPFLSQQMQKQQKVIQVDAGFGFYMRFMWWQVWEFLSTGETLDGAAQEGGISASEMLDMSHLWEWLCWSSAVSASLEVSPPVILRLHIIIIIIISSRLVSMHCMWQGVHELWSLAAAHWGSASTTVDQQQQQHWICSAVDRWHNQLGWWLACKEKMYTWWWWCNSSCNNRMQRLSSPWEEEDG